MRLSLRRRCLVGGVIATLTVSLSPFVASAQPPTSTAPTPSPGTANYHGFDPKHAYALGTTELLQTDAPAEPATGSAAGPADANGGSLALTVNGSVETAQGEAMTSPIAGSSDYLRLHSLGAVARVRSDGRTVWQRNTASLYKDWHLHYTNAGYTATPQIPFGTDPADPYELSTAGPYVVGDTHPYAIGDLTGDARPEVAVAETVGVNLGAADCFLCGWPFTVPGSSLHFGTFVTVLDGRTGATLYSELDPGFVTQLAISDGTLVVGDETGPPSRQNPIGDWNSQSSVHALTFSRQGQAHRAWTYSTGAQWGRLLGLEAVDGGVAIAWSDTPLGLGVPGPPDGHVLVLDRRGHVAWDRRTAGYPVLTRYDRDRHLLAVVEQTDPTVAVSYDVDGLSLRIGATVTSTHTDGALPTALAVGRTWAVADITTTADKVSPPYYSYTGARITAIDPARGQRWTSPLAGATNDEPQPGAIQLVGDSVVVASSLGLVSPTAAAPIDLNDDLQAFRLYDGTPQWQRTGDVGDPLSASSARDSLRLVTDNLDVLSYDARTGRPLDRQPVLGDLYAAALADVNHDGVADYVAGGASGGVYAFDGRSMQHVLWQADVGAPVHQLVTTTVDGRPAAVVADSTGIAVLDLRSGHVRRTTLPGQYVWNVAVGIVHGRTVVTTATDRVTAIDAATGRPLWTFTPPQSAYFANTSIVDGAVVTDYESQTVTAGQASTMAAVGLDATTGSPLWTAPADPATTRKAQLWNGVAGGAGIAGAGADGAAFSWLDHNYDGRVDVRDARTGALLYSNAASDLGNHNGYVLDPQLGLFAYTDYGFAAITPGGPTLATGLSGSGAAIARAGSTPLLLTANAGVSAFPMSVLGSADFVDPVADNETFLAGRLVGTGTGVATLPIDWRSRRIVLRENGIATRAYNTSIQRGLAVLGLTGTPPSTAARHATAAPKQTAARPSTLSLADAPSGRIGNAQPQAVLRVHGYAADGSPELTTPAPLPYDPATMRAYLGLTGTGAGQTVAVVDAPGDPNLASDVAHFDAQFGLPPIDLTVQTPDGTGPTDPNWGLETSMDVEWIHALAPQAAVVLVEAHDGSFAALFRAVDVAARLHPDAISLSWGVPEEFTDETYYDAHCRLADSLCVAASGDYGFPGSYPAYNPAVLSVGGTTLHLGTDGGVMSEAAWSGSGGGRSYVEPVPSYQHGVVDGGRGLPDVSYNADPNTGVAVYDSSPIYGQAGWFQVGGTSLGAPSWSAVLADADQLRTAAGHSRLVGSAAQSAVYADASALGDITSGPANGICPDVCQAGPGYDFVTGLGSPRTGLDAKLSAG